MTTTPIQLLIEEIDRLRQENDRFRKIIARSKADCVYCGLPAEKTSDCDAGFPGCRRIDDIVTSPEFLSGSVKHFREEEELTPTVKYAVSPIPPDGISRINLHEIDPEE